MPARYLIPLICGITIMLMTPVGLMADTIELTGGAVVRGEILRKRADKVIVDLGFTVIEVPMSEVDQIVEGDAGTAPAAASTEIYRTSPGQDELTVKENISRVAEAVVQVRTPTSLGSGFMIHPSGYVVTNQHVISGEHRITVTLFRNGEHDLENLHYSTVRIVALSPQLDLALLKIEHPDEASFVTVPLGDSLDLRQGQTVFAVGSPLGLDRSVSRGIISLTNRVIGGRILVQTTTEINPGNSGGPLFNLRGEVVGVNDLKLMGIGLEGLSFAIPVSVLREFLHNRNAFAFDPRNPNSGFRYNRPPARSAETSGELP